MTNGRVVEQGDADQIFSNPSHPYTQRLLASLPRVSFDDQLSGREPALDRSA